MIISRNAIFDEEGRWNWNGVFGEQRDIPLEPYEESSLTNTTTSSVPFNSSSSTSPTKGSANGQSSPSSHTSSKEALTSRVKTLKELYEKCSFALVVVDPETYEEAIEKTKWVKVVNEDME